MLDMQFILLVRFLFLHFMVFYDLLPPVNKCCDYQKIKKFFTI